MQWLVSTYRVINFPRSYFNTSQFCHTFPEASELFVCYAKSLAFTYLESTLQHPRHKIRKAPSRPNFSYLSGNFSSCVTCNVMVNITTIQQKPQNLQERQKRRDRFLLQNSLLSNLLVQIIQYFIGISIFAQIKLFVFEGRKSIFVQNKTRLWFYKLLNIRPWF